jgi:hypothetical protein
MFKGIMDWFKKKSEEVTAQALVVVRPKPRPAPRPTDPNTKTYLNDPTTPSLMINQLEPAETRLGMRAMGEGGGGYPLGSLQQQALALKLMVNDALIYMAGKSPKPIVQWAAVQSLMLMPRAGKDINAYYDRSSLRFFYFGDHIAMKNVFACEARPVVVHEFGHAFLDILRPDWWSVQGGEVWAFHEAFGDITATLNALQYDALIDAAIAETGGDLMKSNVLTRLAAEMGIGLYHITNGKNGELPNCLRDLSQVFKYVEPEKLPAQGRDNVLLSESHSFSRVFTGMFWELLVKIAAFHTAQGMAQKDALKLSRDVLAHYLLAAVVNAPTTLRLFDAIARQMLHEDQAGGGKYQAIMQQVFTDRNIIRQQVMLLADVDMDSVLKDMKEPHEVQVHGDAKIVRTLSTKTMKLADKLGPLTALDDNPLFALEITVPCQTAYYFDADNNLTGVVEPHEDEIVDAAYNCLKFLHEGDLVGTHGTALFENKYGKLVRKQIICTCARPNYCDPNAPEYNKPWKPANNSGCVKCHNGKCKPQSCDCNPPETPSAPKTGCFAVVKAGGRTTYKYGSSASRKVC